MSRNAQFSFGIEPDNCIQLTVSVDTISGRSLVEGSEESESNTVNPAVAQAIAGIPLDHVCSVGS